MFADIVGSTRLYEILGDKSAEELISNTLRQLSRIIADTGGETIKTIGDEVMCRFGDVDQAVTAAKTMHEFLAQKPAPSKDFKLAIRVGAHHGPAIETDGDLFGDTVNIAARIAALARAGKTMITGYSYESLPAATRQRCRHITRTTVRGKEHPLDVYEVVWELTDELTRVVGSQPAVMPTSRLTIKYGDKVIRLSASDKTSASLGRSPNCDLVILSPHASREHCRIECNRGKFILHDNSSNGSYVIHNSTELLFHQERVPLLGKGTISLGAPTTVNPEFVLSYSIDLADAAQDEADA